MPAKTHDTLTQTDPKSEESGQELFRILKKALHTGCPPEVATDKARKMAGIKGADSESQLRPLLLQLPVIVVNAISSLVNEEMPPTVAVVAYLGRDITYRLEIIINLIADVDEAGIEPQPSVWGPDHLFAAPLLSAPDNSGSRTFLDTARAFVESLAELRGEVNVKVGQSLASEGATRHTQAVIGRVEFFESSRVPAGDVEYVSQRLGAVRESVLNPLTERYGGFRIRDTGDQILIAFPSASDAITWAQDARRNLASSAELQSLSMRSRVSLGLVDVRSDAVDALSRRSTPALLSEKMISLGVRRTLVLDGIRGSRLGYWSPSGFEADVARKSIDHIVSQLLDADDVPLAVRTETGAKIREILRLARAEFQSSPARGLKPPVPALTDKQVAAIISFGKKHPYAKRKETDQRSPFEWIRDRYSKWYPGILMNHLKAADSALWSIVHTRRSRAKSGKYPIPDWFDVPTKEENDYRAATPEERVKIDAVREVYRRRNRARLKLDR